MKLARYLELFTASSLLLNCITYTELVTVTAINLDAIIYVGNTNPENGLMQLELIKNEGAQPSDYVLEIGCGALVGGIPIMSFFDAEHYVGIDPNKWLIADSLRIEDNARIAREKKPIFLYNPMFDASELGLKFDYIIAHSIMSHAPFWQLKLFLENCSKVLKDGGKVIFSLRLTEPNQWGNQGSSEESTTTDWQYPGNTFFKKSTVEQEAFKFFTSIELKPHYTAIITSSDKSAYHDWFVATK